MGGSIRFDCMKILYIAHERRTAEAAAHGLRSIAPNVTLTWAPTPGAALRWIQDNRDTPVVIVDAGMQSQGDHAFLEQVRGLGVTTPVAMIAAEHLTGQLGAVKADLESAIAHERKESEILETLLKEIEEWRRQAQQLVAEREAQHDAALARTTRICTTLQTRLLELEAALRHADERHAADTAAAERSSLRESARETALSDATSARLAVEHSLAAAEAAHDHAQQRAAAELASAMERCVALEDRLTRETAARTGSTSAWPLSRLQGRTPTRNTRRSWTH